MKKILLFHDTFLMKGGAERMNILFAKMLNADIATTVWDKNCYNPEDFGFEGKIIQMHPNFRRGMMGFLKMKLAFIFSKNNRKTLIKNYCKKLQKEKNEDFSLDEYDIIFFSNEAISGIWQTKKGTKTFYYAHSISRHLFDLYDDYLAKVPGYAKIPYRIMAFILRKLYIKELQKIDTVFVNSLANQKRLKKWTGKDSIILYPFVDTENFSYCKNLQYMKKYKNWENIESKFFLSFARLTHIKGIDKIIRAFHTSSHHILILFGPQDSQREEFMQLAKITPTKEQDRVITSQKFENIHFLSISDNKALPEIISNATATICMSKNEDFGMVSIESMACEVPVVAPAQGGYLETIIPHETGILLDENSQEALENFLKNIDIKVLENMKKNCRTQAEKFSLKKIEEKLKQILGCEN